MVDDYNGNMCTFFHDLSIAEVYDWYNIFRLNGMYNNIKYLTNVGITLATIAHED